MLTDVYIRSDGFAEIGLGHLVRCLALAHILKKDFTISFFCKSIPEHLAGQIENDGFILIRIQSEQEFTDHIRRTGIVVLDGYHFDTDFQQRVKASGCLLVCIDDLHDKHFVADIIINHAPGVDRAKYSAEPYTLFLLGPSYALLRPIFLSQASLTRNRTIIEDVLICFGGSDFRNLTIPVAEVVLQQPMANKITIITGNSYPRKSELSEFVKRHPRKIKHLHSITEGEMVECMLSNQLAIVPASGILLEALATKCIIVCGYYAENQKDLYNGFLKENAIIGCEDFNEAALKVAFEYAFSPKRKYIPKSLLDGESGNRIRREFIDLYSRNNITYRLANGDDCLQYFEWVNEESVRQNSRLGDKIPWEAHQNWFTQKLNSKDIEFYIFHIKNRPIGQVRFEFDNDKWVINYSIDKDFRGKGLGKHIIAQSVEELRKHSTQPIIAFVKENNVPSIKVFEKLNFKLDEVSKGYLYFRL